MARLDLTLALLARGEREGAARVVDELTERGANLSQGDRLLTQALHAFYREGNVELGSKTLEELARRYSLPAGAHFAWAQALSDIARDPLDSARRLRVAVETDPDDLLAIAGLAARLKQFGDLEAAKGILDDAARRHPDRAEALRRLVGQLGTTGP